MPFVIDNIQYTVSLCEGTLIMKAYDLQKKIKYYAKTKDSYLKKNSVFKSAEQLYKILMTCFRRPISADTKYGEPCSIASVDNIRMVVSRTRKSNLPSIGICYNGAITEHRYICFRTKQPTYKKIQLQNNLESINNKLVSLENEIAKFTNILGELVGHNRVLLHLLQNKTTNIQKSTIAE